MNQPIVVYPPNKPLERLLAPSTTPVSYNYLYFIDVNDKGELITGSSNVAGCYWEGTLYHYKNGAAAVTEQYNSYYISGSCMADGKFIKNSDYIIIAEDSGHFKLLTLVEDGQRIKCKDIFNTNARIEQLAVWNDSHKVIACADTSVSIWDMENRSNKNPVEEFRNFHTGPITSVDVSRNQINLFASASIDRRACIWDDRMKEPAVVLYQNEFAALTSIAWNPTQSEYIAVGSQGGDLYKLDIRQLKEFTDSHHCFDASIHRAAFSNNTEFLAVCGDTSEVLVLNTKDDFNVVYRSNAHSNFVRGVAWFEETLYSCGFDKKVIKHVL